MRVSSLEVDQVSKKGFLQPLTPVRFVLLSPPAGQGINLLPGPPLASDCREGKAERCVLTIH